MDQMSSIQPLSGYLSQEESGGPTKRQTMPSTELKGCKSGDTVECQMTLNKQNNGIDDCVDPGTTVAL